MKRIFVGTGLRATFMRAAFGTAGIQVVSLMLTFLVGVQLSRGLGPAGLGLYAFALSIATLIGIPTEFGLSQVAVREAAAASEKADWPYFKGISRFATGAVAVSSIIVAIIAEIVLHSTSLGDNAARRTTIEVSLLLIPLVAQNKLCGALLMGMGQIVKGQFANLILRPGLFAVLIAVTTIGLQSGLTAPVVMWLQVGGTVMALVVSVGLFRRAVPTEARNVIARYEARAWLIVALPMAMTDGMKVLQGHLSVFLLGALSTPEQVGLYRVADSTSAMIGFPASMFNIIAVAIFARLWAAKDTAALRKLSAAITLATLTGVIGLALPIWFAGHELLTRVFGAQFGAAYGPLLIGTGSSVVIAGFGPCGVLMNMSGGERSVARAFGVSAISNLVISLITIPELGSRGAALGALAGTLIWNLILWAEARKRLGIDTSVLAIPRYVNMASMRALFSHKA